MPNPKELGGDNYVFWGGRERYETLLNTDMKKEQDQMAAFFHMAVDYAKKTGKDILDGNAGFDQLEAFVLSIMASPN